MEAWKPPPGSISPPSSAGAAPEGAPGLFSSASTPPSAASAPSAPASGASASGALASSALAPSVSSAVPRVLEDFHPTRKFKYIFIGFDGGSRRPQSSVIGFAGAGAVVFSAGLSAGTFSEQLRCARYLGLASNNEDEGHGCLLACLAARSFHSEEVVIRGDSILIVRAIKVKIELVAACL